MIPSLVTTLLALTLVACAPTADTSAAADPPPPATAAPAADQAATRTEPGEVDYGCEVDADCAIKDVGNCCGYYPACVNKDSPTFPDQVMARCEAEGLSSICGFPELRGCRCVAGRCEGVPGTGAAQSD